MSDSAQHKRKIAPLAAGASTVLGLLFNYFFYGQEQIGLSFPAFFFVLAIAAIVLYVYSAGKPPTDLWLAAPILFFACIPAIRDNPFLVLLNIAAILGLLTLLLRSAAGIRAKSMDVLDHFWNILTTPFSFLRSWIDLSRFLGGSIPRITKESTGFRVVKGLFVALPVLVVFASLFSTADLAFARYLSSIFSFEIPEAWIQQTIIVLIGTCFAAGVLWRMLTAEPRAEPESQTVLPGPSRGIEVATFLGSVAILFLCFIIIQVAYLFGGESNITELGFTYAEYARNGFWELIAVAIITLALLILAERVTNKSDAGSKAFIIPATFIVCEVFVIIFSAFKRLELYVVTYGETTLRFYVAAAIMFLFVLFVIAGYRIIRSKRESFLAYGTLLALIAFVAAIDLINPDAFIVRKNFELYAKTGKIDVAYLGNLSADGVPELLRNMERLGADEKDQLRRILAEKKMRLGGNYSWRSWSRSRAAAAEMLKVIETPTR